jgi:hypothetical protein
VSFVFADGKRGSMIVMAILFHVVNHVVSHSAVNCKFNLYPFCGAPLSEVLR